MRLLGSNVSRVKMYVFFRHPYHDVWCSFGKLYNFTRAPPKGPSILEVKGLSDWVSMLVWGRCLNFTSRRSTSLHIRA